MLIKLLEVAFAVVFCVAWATQVVAPVWRQTPLFPWFRREQELRHQLSLENQKRIEAELAAAVRQKAQETKAFNRERNS